MKLLLLAGNSLNNKKWIEDVEKILAPHFSETKIHYYRHWATGDELIDLEYELSELIKSTDTLENWIIFAKSAGTILVIRGFFEGKLKPLKCIFTGTAVRWAEAQGMNVQEWLKNFSVPTLFIQKTSDPAISYKELKALLVGLVNSTTKEISGDDHRYDDLQQLEQEVIDFLK